MRDECFVRAANRCWPFACVDVTLWYSTSGVNEGRLEISFWFVQLCYFCAYAALMSIFSAADSCAIVLAAPL